MDRSLLQAGALPNSQPPTPGTWHMAPVDGLDAPTHPSVRLVQLADANGLPSLRTGARRQDRALSGRELGILLPLHDTALIEMTSGRIIPLLSFSALCCLIL